MKQMREVTKGMVKCKRCLISKLRKEFRHDKIDYNCKDCLSNIRAELNRTKRGLAFKLHATQRRNSREREHPLPTYSKEELYDWLLKQPNFNQLFEQWVGSNYDRQLVPSCDRVRDEFGYSFGNIELKTYRDNRGKYGSQKINGNAHNNDCKAIYQYDMSGMFIAEFYSIAQAVRELRVISNAVSKVCKYTLQQHHGWVFRYKEEISDRSLRLEGLIFKRKPNRGVV